MKMRFLAVCLMCAMAMVGCSRDAQVASKNLSYAADNFELDRRVVFYNGITGEYIAKIYMEVKARPRYIIETTI